MKVTLEATSQIVQLENGQQARLWEGRSEEGARCFAVIASIGVHVDDDASQFEKELVAGPPTPALWIGRFFH